MRFARHQGKPVRQILSEYDSQELSEQMALDRIDPLEDGWRQAGVICSALAKVMGDAKAKWIPIDAWIPATKPKQTPETMMARFAAWADGHNTKLKNKR